MLKFSKPGFNSTWTRNFQVFKLNQRSSCQHPLAHWKSKSVPEKHLLLLYWLHQSLWLWGSQQTVESSKEMGIPDHLTCLLINHYAGQVATELDMEQQTGSKYEKEYVKAVYCHPDYLIYMQSTSWETLSWRKHKLELRLMGEIWIQICRWHHPYGRKWRRTKEPPDESERGEWKCWPKIQHSEK